MNPTGLTNLTPDERRSFFPAFVAVPVEVHLRRRDVAVPATFEALCEPIGAVVLLRGGEALLAPLADICISHETLHALERRAAQLGT